MKRTVLALTIALGTLSAAASQVQATADGPDYFRVVGVPDWDRLNIRSGPSARFRVIGTIPYDGRRITNLAECLPKVSIDQYQQMTPWQVKQLRRRTWCRISYRGVTGWVASRFLAED